LGIILNKPTAAIKREPSTNVFGMTVHPENPHHPRNPGSGSSIVDLRALELATIININRFPFGIKIERATRFYHDPASDRLFAWICVVNFSFDLRVTSDWRITRQ